ncbi:hypothetical protein MCEMRE22_01023 [Candidatus Nanopelagicaceae bacterium]
MAKKKPDNTEAKISKLPVELSDAPLVIDLPDGQKIILSKLQEGAVIEVATWHGTGRPDSRTNRFMLGMTTGQSVSAPEASATGVSQGNSSDLSKTLTGKMDVAIKSAKSLLKNLSQPLKSAMKKSKELTPVDSTTDLEINAWLDSLKSEVISKAKTAPVKRAVSPAKKAAKKQPATKNARK